jgi:hypothetical protein
MPDWEKRCCRRKGSLVPARPGSGGRRIGRDNAGSGPQILCNRNAFSQPFRPDQSGLFPAASVRMPAAKWFDSTGLLDPLEPSDSFSRIQSGQSSHK